MIDSFNTASVALSGIHAFVQSLLTAYQDWSVWQILREVVIIRLTFEIVIKDIPLQP